MLVPRGWCRSGVETFGLTASDTLTSDKLLWIISNMCKDVPSGSSCFHISANPIFLERVVLSTIGFHGTKTQKRVCLLPDLTCSRDDFLDIS